MDKLFQLNIFRDDANKPRISLINYVTGEEIEEVDSYYLTFLTDNKEEPTADNMCELAKLGDLNIVHFGHTPEEERVDQYSPGSLLASETAVFQDDNK